MDPITQQGLAGAAGAGGDPVYVDDVFSTFLYDGTGSTQSINNGIDLSGEGGMVWFKRRDDATDHQFYDTERGATKGIQSTNYAAESTRSGGLTAFNSNGFTLGTWTDENGSGNDQCSWSFRKAPGFFDVVTYTGNGTAGRQIAHNLGSVPGMIFIKNLNSAYDWIVYHRSLANTHYLYLNDTASAGSARNTFNNTTATSTHFTIGNHGSVNLNTDNFVAYIFAHDDQSFGTGGDESIIKCGSYTGGGNTSVEVNLGFEPQLVLIKCSSTSNDWVLYDNMRGVIDSNQGDMQLIPNGNAAETNENRIDFYSQGFRLENAGSPTNASGETFVYMAIRRPHKPPTAATEVFALDTLGGTNSGSRPGFHAGFPVDLGWYGTNSSDGFTCGSRLQGKESLLLHSSNAAANDASVDFAYQDGWLDSTSVVSSYVSWMFRRAPGFLDVVAYTGTGSSRTVNHNLEATPQLLIIKKRSATDSWVVYTTVIDNSMDYMYLNNDSAKGDSSSGLPSSTAFSLSSGTQVNGSGSTYIGYLFASLSGISKVGTYTGTGNNINVDCGFTAGARFVLIKRTDSSGGWYVWDTLRGIVSGNDPYFLLNSNAAQVTNTDYIDPLNAGFTVTSSAPAALNASGGTYLFLAIA